MNKNKISLAVAVASLATIGSTSALADNVGARNLGMGGTGVASSNYDAAPSINPALLTEFKENDDISLTLFSVGVEASDEEEVIDTLDDVTDAYDLLELQIDSGNRTGANATKNGILADLSDISGDQVRVQAEAGISLAMPSKSFAWAIDVNANVDVAASTLYADSDGAIIDAAILSGNSDLLDSTTSAALVVGTSVIEYGISFAKEFQLDEHKFSVGVRPKMQDVETILYYETASDFDSDDYDDDRNTTDDSNFNLDIGASYWFSDEIILGLTVRDIVGEEYDTVNIAGFQTSYEIDPSATVGIAYNGSAFTAAFDVDLTERNSFSDVDGSQFAKVGVEYNLANWVQLRAGYRADLEDNQEDVVTAGIGLSPFDVLHIDVAALTGSDSTVGGQVDIKFTF